ncbi:penicillin-binding protein 1B [Alteromonadaceae bacterium M269]|nr:penicillin-binding protein 1B [Alteromonadaceae bacterium M269]
MGKYLARPFVMTWQWFKRHFWQLFFVFLVIMVAYGFYLDAKIQATFDGNKWQVPTQIYARALTLEKGQEIARGEIIEELKLLGYRKVRTPKQSGDYSLSQTKLSLIRREYESPNGFETQEALTVSFANGRVSRIVNTNTAEERNKMQLEPWLVTRLVSGAKEDRMLVAIDEVPQSLIDALILVEDRDFYNHYGIAPLGILRALMANIAAGRAVQGGSTLTQQLIKNLFLSNRKSIPRKAQEALMALVIELRYDKDEILQAYLNEVFLGQSGANAVHGFGLASHFYFDRPLNELAVPEIATLVGMIKGPSYYNPRRHPERAETRRNIVLRLMMEHHVIDPQQYESYAASPITLVSSSRFGKGKHPAFMDKVKRELSELSIDASLTQSGLKVYTTLDPHAQRQAERAITQGLTHLERQRKLDELQGAMMVTDINSGEIRAMVGARDTQFQGFNRVIDAKRPIGSLVKPAIYLAALEQAESYQLSTPLKDEPITLQSDRGNTWSPKNADKKFRGQVRLLDALVKSLNVPTVNLGMELGLGYVADMLHVLGVTEPVNEYPSLTLGAVNLSPLQVNQMYQTIANNGEYKPLHALLAVSTVNDNILWKREVEGQQRVDENAAYLLNFGLHKVTKEGTATLIDKTFPNTNMAGKTGTTDDYRDSWFTGFDKYNLVTTWVGKDDNQSTGLSGASGALGLFVSYQKGRYPKSLARRFPSSLAMTSFDADTGVHLQPGCPNSVILPAISDALPEAQSCEGQLVLPQPKKKSLWDRLFGRRG